MEIDVFLNGEVHCSMLVAVLVDMSSIHKIIKGQRRCWIPRRMGGDFVFEGCLCEIWKPEITARRVGIPCREDSHEFFKKRCP